MPAYPIRQGLSLTWGPAAAPSAGPASHLASTARLTFILIGETAHRDDRMIASAGHATDAAAPEGAFVVTLDLAATALDDLLHGDAGPGAARLRAYASAPPAPAPVTFPLGPGARLCVDSIRRCPFVGACRGMALTARCHDLLLEFLTALSAEPAAPARLPPASRSLDEQIRAAAAHLAQNLEEPPTLARLARQVGLSESGLKRGFQRVFATTVFGYLRERRLERAHALLQSGEATVLEAAALVGYSNPSNFAAAFRRRFGVNPKTFQLTARR